MCFGGRSATVIEGESNVGALSVRVPCLSTMKLIHGFQKQLEFDRTTSTFASALPKSSPTIDPSIPKTIKVQPHDINICFSLTKVNTNH
jgi:hypothetical protein